MHSYISEIVEKNDQKSICKHEKKLKKLNDEASFNFLLKQKFLVIESTDVKKDSLNKYELIEVSQVSGVTVENKIMVSRSTSTETYKTMVFKNKKVKFIKAIFKNTLYRIIQEIINEKNNKEFALEVMFHIAVTGCGIKKDKKLIKNLLEYKKNKNNLTSIKKRLKCIEYDEKTLIDTDDLK